MAKHNYMVGDIIIYYNKIYRYISCDQYGSIYFFYRFVNHHGVSLTRNNLQKTTLYNPDKHK